MGSFFNIKIVFVILILLICVLAMFLYYRQKQLVYNKQNKELQMYQLYVKPLEELIREIRARQHEFDNHLNALLSMHYTISTYDELVKAQADYMRGLVSQKENTYIGLLKISNKVLAGYLYSKLVSMDSNIQVELIIGSQEIFTNVPEMELVEVIGTLFDNAVQACDEAHHFLQIYLTSQDDKFLFIIKNMHDKISISTLSHFFERGFSTKENGKNQGLGLYNARKIIKRWNGEIYVENEEVHGKNYLCFHVEL